MEKRGLKNNIDLIDASISVGNFLQENQKALFQTTIGKEISREAKTLTKILTKAIEQGDVQQLFTQRAVKPRPSGRGYKAHLDWNFCLSAFCVLTGDTAAGHAVSACGEIVRPGGIGGWFVPVKFPTWECLRRKPSLVPLGSLVEAGTRSGMQSQDCLRWESPDFRRGRMSISNT